MTTRPLSFWGWGYQDKFPTAEERQGLAEQISAMLGFTGLEVQSPPTLDAIELPAPRIELTPALQEFCTMEKRERARHTYGRSFPDIIRGFRGDFSSPPDAVAYPTTEQQIEQLLAWGGENRVAVIPFGGGTSVVGGVNSQRPEHCQGVITLDLTHMAQVVEVDSHSQLARIQAGVKGPALEQQLAQQGLTLRHYPQSFEFSTLGGWVATRAGGHFATLYTHIDDLVSSVRMLTPVGLWQTSTLPASGAGPDANRMVLGSEGTLGVITEATVRVRPRPVFRARANVHFTDWGRAVEAVRSVAQAGLYPANCRLLDAREAMLNSVCFDGSHVMLLGFESAHHPVEHWLTCALAIAQDYGGTLPEEPVIKHPDPTQDSAPTADAAQVWRQAFLEAPYLFNSLISIGVLVDTFETACTWSQFEALHSAIIRNVRDALKQECGKGFVSCRFTHVYPDGPAPYYTFLGPARRGAELEQWQAIKTAASETLAAHGATITHHHAVGRTHRPWYQREVPELMLRALQHSKQALDPHSILNPGVLFDPLGV